MLQKIAPANHTHQIRQAIQADKKFPRKPKADIEAPTLYRGWLIPVLLGTDDVISGRWDYWAKCMEGRLPDEPIPTVDWVDGSGLNTPARKMLEASLNAVPRSGGWEGWSGWQYFDYFLNWLLYGFGHSGQPELPVEPLGCEGASDRLYQVFCLEAVLAWPHDYLGDILAENRHGRAQGFYPTPMSICRMMAMTLGVKRTETVCDPCLGTGRLLLAASDYSLRLYGMDINGTVIKATLVNGFLYAPWLVRPIPYLDGDQYDPAQSVAISDALAASTNGRPDVDAYLANSEHDAEQQWRFEPVKKRRRRGTTVEKDVEETEILQGVLF